MSERCKNCDSTDIVEIQGQKFCINCGEPYTAASSATKSNVEVQVEKTAAVKEPAPKPKSVSPAKKAAKGAKSASVAASAAIVPVAVSAPVASSAPPSATTPPLDLRSKKANLKTPPTKLVAKTKQENKKYEQASSPAAARQIDERHRPEPAPDTRPHPLGFSVKVALLTATPVAVVIGALVWFRFDLDTVAYVAAICAVLVFIILSMAQSAILYGMSRAYDHRPAPRKQWWSAARNGVMDVTNIDIMTAIAAMVTVGAAAAGWQWLGTFNLTGWLEVGSLLILNALAAWLLLGAAIARHIAIPATVIGGMSSTETYKLGWKTFIKAGGSLSLALVQALTARIIVLLAAFFTILYFSQHLPEYNHTVGVLIIAGCTGFFTALLIVTALQLESRIWLRHYRYWIARCYPQRQLRLLAGRVQTLRHR